MKKVTDSMVQSFIDNWYRMMDLHAPLKEVLESIDTNAFQMQIIDGPMILGEKGFSDWYNEKISTSFDSKHTVHSIEFKIHDDTVDATIIADWSGRNWIIPQVKSEEIAFLDKLLIKLKYSEAAGRLQLTEYLVKSAD